MQVVAMDPDGGNDVSQNFGYVLLLALFAFLFFQTYDFVTVIMEVFLEIETQFYRLRACVGIYVDVLFSFLCLYAIHWNKVSSDVNGTSLSISELKNGIPQFLIIKSDLKALKK